MPFCQIIQKRIHISYAKVAFNFYMTLQKNIRQPYFLGSSFANALFIIESISKLNYVNVFETSNGSFIYAINHVLFK